MAHLFSSPSEVLALKAICSKDRAISGFMLSSVDESYFHNEESQEAYDAIIKYMGRKGSVPAFGLLVEELGLSEGAREFLKLSEGRVKTQQQAEQLVESLGGYRRTRLLYKLAKGILNRLQKDSVDVQALSEAVADKVAIINSARSNENSIWHIGRESNVSELIEEIIYGEDTTHVIPTGFKHYDGINGGFKRGSLVLIGGSTGSGKSSFYETNVSLSTLVIELDDEWSSTMEAEPTENILVLRNGKPIWIEAQDVVEGDEIIVDPKVVTMRNARVKAIRNKTIQLGEMWDTLPTAPIDKEGDDKEWRSFVTPVSVHTPSGTALAVNIYKTKDHAYRITLDNGVVLRSGGDHRYHCAERNGWVLVRNIAVGTRLTNDPHQDPLTLGYNEVVSIEREAEPIDLYDIQVPGPECYYANGILSHNSLISNQLAMNQASIGYKIHFVPLEMTEQEMLSRSIANVSGIDGSKIQLRRMAEAEKEQAHKRWRRFERRMLKAGGRLTIFKPQSDMRIEEVMGALHAMPGDVKYIDYVSLLKGTDGEDQWRQLGNIARYGKIYAANTHSVVVLLCQVTDDGVVRYSRTMAEHANTSWIFTATKETREKGFLRVEMTKGRNERLITFVLKVDYSTQKATDMTPEELDELAAASAGSAKKGAKKGAKKSGRSNESNKEEGDEYLPDLTGDSV